MRIFIILVLMAFYAQAAGAQTDRSIEAVVVPGFGHNSNVDGLLSLTGSIGGRAMIGTAAGAAEYLQAGVGVSFYRYGVSYNKASLGTQTLSYIDVPVIYRLFTSGRVDEVATFVDLGINTGILAGAEWTADPGPYTSVIPHPTHDAGNRSDYHAVALRPVIGLGIVLNATGDARGVLGLQLSSAVVNQNKTGTVQNYPVKVPLGMFSATFGFQVRISKARRI